MRGYFGQTLLQTQAIRPELVRDTIVQISPRALADAADNLAQYVGQENTDGGRVASEAHAILEDVRAEVTELTTAVGQTNDPSLRALRLARAKVAAMHGALFVGRLIYRSAAAALEFGSQAATIVMLVEVASPGSIRSAYEVLRTAIPDLPPLPSL